MPIPFYFENFSNWHKIDLKKDKKTEEQSLT